MDQSDTIIEAARKYVQDLLLSQLPPAFVYHNFEHTEEVYEVCLDLATKGRLEDKDKEVLLLAALFQNTGYVEGTEGCAARSADRAAAFLKERNYPIEQIEKLAGLIHSLNQKKEPATLLEKMLHDAYWSFLGRKRFERRSQLLQLETEHIEGEKFSLYDWDKHLLDLQINTKFYTPWAHERFTTRRNKNISDHREKLVRTRKQTIRKQTGKDFGRGVDTVYRVTLRNHINLSSIADGKANMIISINTLVLSILITAGSAGFSLLDFSQGTNLQFIIPVLVLMVSSLTAIVFAVLSAIPNISGTEFTEEDVRNHKVSLLYFGNFLKLPKDDFVNYLRDLKEDQVILYDDLSRDLYNLGAVLRKKYRLLTIAYRVFVGGLVVSVATFLVMYLFV